MKPFKSKWQEHGNSDDRVDRANKRAKRFRPQEEEMEYHPRMNRPTDVSEYLDDAEEDFQPPHRRP